MNKGWKRTFTTQEIRDAFYRYVDFLGVFASQTASWLVSGAETSTTRFSFFLSIDWCRFHCDPLSNEWGDTSYWTTYIHIYTHTHTHPKSRYFMTIELPAERLRRSSLNLIIIKISEKSAIEIQKSHILLNFQLFKVLNYFKLVLYFWYWTKNNCYS